MPAAGGAAGRLAGVQRASAELAAAAVHSSQCSQADCIPDSGMHAARAPHEPELQPVGLPPAKLSCQGGEHRSSHRAVPVVMAAVSHLRGFCAFPIAPTNELGRMKTKAFTISANLRIGDEETPPGSSEMARQGWLASTSH